MHPDHPLPLLGGLTPRAFLRDYWQKKPLLVRGAMPDFVEPLTGAEVFTLAARDEAESRLVEGRGTRWSLTHGPISARRRGTLKRSAAPWTVLVQDVQHHSHEAHALLARFGFISHARIDDLMVSYAVDGGGVGPHLDSYDVFLLQGSGKRKWQISTQKDHALVDGAPLKILKRFRPEREYVLQKGDMLYLPPQVAHHGVAVGECLTWSIGFRAPAFQELGEFFLDAGRDALRLHGQYKDPKLRPARHPGAVDTQMQASMLGVLRRVAAGIADDRAMARALGCFLTAPKPHVTFSLPDEVPDLREFARLAQARGVRLALATRMLRCSDEFFANGELLPSAPADGKALLELADRRELRPVRNGGKVAASPPPFARSLCRTLLRLYEAGALDLAPIHKGNANG